MKKDVDYSLYLVTDSTPAILGDRDLISVVERALVGGVTCVQYRDKTSDTGVLIATARKLHAVTQKHGVPLLINDRVDVALAVGCEGVHVGQDDMSAVEARKLLGSGKIVGVSASTVEEAVKACEDGADYLGLGAVFATNTKKDTKHVIGTAGIAQVLQTLEEKGHKTKTVCIGGINATNIPSVVYKSAAGSRQLDGVAIVSAIIAADDPEQAAKTLLELVRTLGPFGAGGASQAVKSVSEVNELLALVPQVIKDVAASTPLSHNMTNLVVQNFAANVALAIGASPIMSNSGAEASDLAKLGGALVVNMGTATPESLENYCTALRAYNQAGRPVVFDPVGAGATAVRKAAVKTITSAGYISIIKGNEGEIATVYGQAGAQQRGVDSSSTLDASQKAALVKALAAREHAIVVLTGATDFLSDGTRVYTIANGDPYLGLITGSGCVLGTTISAMAAAYKGGDKLVPVLAGLLLFEIAAEMAAVRQDVQGPGTFVSAFIDELYRVRVATAKGDLRWLSVAKVKKVE